jgi:predicted trehalose synthase
MDPTTMVYLLIALMTVSGGIMGAFWLRALTLMRRRVIDSAEALEQLVETVAELRNEMTVLGERVHF